MDSIIEDIPEWINQASNQLLDELANASVTQYIFTQSNRWIRLRAEITLPVLMYAISKAYKISHSIFNAERFPCQRN